MVRSIRSRTSVVGVLAVAALAAAGAPALAQPADPARPAALDPGLTLTGGDQHVVVSGRPGASAAVRAAVLAAGGTATRALPVIDGWAATVPSSVLDELAGAPAVTAVTADRAVQLAGTGYDESVSSSPYAWTSQAANLRAQGIDGAGVGVAVLDTGVSDVRDLSGRVLAGPDLSGEGMNTVDSFGHGTVMAGIVAGSGAASGSKPRTGAAPGAHIVSVKVAGANGASDVSTMLAGMSWVNAFADTYGIKVLSLSWGVPSTQNPAIDPLDFAVERLWANGIVVVAAAGNSGPNAGTILKPGDDPLVVTVGAYDDKQTLKTSDDMVPTWASQGPTAWGLAKPDLVASGRSLVATRSPGSTVERMNPAALVGTDYITGSGSSEATALVAGVTALLRQAHPGWSPDQVKAALKRTASPMLGVSSTKQGAGRVQAVAALSADVSNVAPQVSLATGLGTLSGSRAGSAPVQVSCDGNLLALTGEMTTWCQPWTGAAWTGAAWTGAAWTGAAWTSYDESDGGDPPTGFQTAFFGTTPRPGLSIVGELYTAVSGVLPTP